MDSVIHWLKNWDREYIKWVHTNYLDNNKWIKGESFVKKLRCFVGGGNKVIWLYQLSWICKPATATNQKADISSISSPIHYDKGLTLEASTCQPVTAANPHLQPSWYNQIALDNSLLTPEHKQQIIENKYIQMIRLGLTSSSLSDLKGEAGRKKTTALN